MRTKYLRRTLKGTQVTCRFVELASNTVVSDTVFITGSYKDVNKVFKAVEKQTAEGYRLVAVDEFVPVEKVYKISEEKFIENAELVG